MFVHLDEIDIMDEGWVAEVIEAIDDNRIEFSIQGIHPIQESDGYFYGECLARLRSKEGKLYPASYFIPLLDIWGSTPILDRHVLNLVLDRLEENSTIVLGSNISTENLTDASEWKKIRDILIDRGHLLPRLVLEITGTRPLIDVVETNHRLTEARQLGCSIAVDGFGSGHMTPNQLLLLDLDIIKIDAMFVQDIRPSKVGGNNLFHMVGLAACSVPRIVVEGVETREQLCLARLSGATHAQGYFLSKSVNSNTGEMDSWIDM